MKHHRHHQTKKHKQMKMMGSPTTRDRTRQARVRALAQEPLNQAAIKHLTKGEMIWNQMPVLTLMMKGMVLRQEMIDKMSPEEQTMMVTMEEQEETTELLTDLMMAEPKEALMSLTKSDDDPHLGERLVALLEAEKDPEQAAVQLADNLVGILQGMGQETDLAI